MRAILASIGALFLASGLSAQCRLDNGADRAYRESQPFLAAGMVDGGGSRSELDEGIVRLESAIKLDPECVDALLALAKLYWNGSFLHATSDEEVGRWRNRSRDLLRQAIALRPAMPEPYYQLALEVQDPVERAALLRKLVELAPNFPRGHATLARILLELGDVEGAVREYRAHLGLSPPPESWSGDIGFAVELARGGRIAEAVEIITAVLKLAEGAPKFEQCRRVLPLDLAVFKNFPVLIAKVTDLKKYCTRLEHRDQGVKLLRKGRVDEAIIEFEEQLRINPYYSETYFLLGEAYSSQGRTEDAIGVIERYLVIENDPSERCRAIERFRKEVFRGKERERFRALEKQCEGRDGSGKP